MNQSVSLCAFGTVKRVFSPACRTYCLTGEASAIYDPCGNMISLIDKGTATEARAVDNNSNATIGIYNPYNMEIPFSAQATINPSYDHPIEPFEINYQFLKQLFSGQDEF